jgi:MatE
LTKCVYALRLAAPIVLVMVVQASVGLIETYFVGKLGTDALAGVALVFPALMLMQMMSAGAMGGGISSAIARALGGGRRSDADAWLCTRLPSPPASGLRLPPQCSPEGHGSTPRWAGEAHRSTRR